MTTPTAKQTSDVAAGNGHAIPETAPELQRGPNWLRELRFKSRDVFNSTPVPPRGLHLWRYTDPEKFLVSHEELIDTSFGTDFDTAEKVLLSELAMGNLTAGAITRGARDVKLHGADKLAEQGGVMSGLSDAVRNSPEIVQKHLYSLVSEDVGKFEAQNSALWNDGVFINIAPGKTIEKPIHLLREAGLGGSAHFPRLLVVVGENAEVTIVDEYGGGAADLSDGPAYSNAAVEIIAGRDSRVRYVVLQRQGAGTYSYLTHRARIDSGTTMFTIPLAFGATIAKHNYGVELAGKNAESNMYGLAFGSARQHFDYHTLHHHSVGETLSNIDYKVVLRDKALSAYTGLIRIEQDARTCEAYQENRNLLLSKGAKAETIPELEILNEDVRCSHGATIGPIDPLEVFYLQSRGLPAELATRMIVAGYAEATMKRLPDDLKPRIRESVMRRLETI